MVNMDKNTENIFRKQYGKYLQKTPIVILSLLARFSRQRHKLAIKKSYQVSLAAILSMTT